MNSSEGILHRENNLVVDHHHLHVHPRPCLICGQILGVKSESVDEEEGQSRLHYEELHESAHHHLQTVETEPLLLHCFYKLFQIEPLEETNWNLRISEHAGEDQNSSPFCQLCKQRLNLLMGLQRNLEELQKRIEVGKEELKKALECSEESLRKGGIYEKDKRYLRIRRHILGHKAERSPVPIPTSSTASPHITKEEQGTTSTPSGSRRRPSSPNKATKNKIKNNPFVLLSATDRKYAEVQKKEPPSFDDPNSNNEEINFPPSAWTSSDSEDFHVDDKDEYRDFNLSGGDESDPDFEIKPEIKKKLKIVKKRNRKEAKSNTKTKEVEETPTSPLKCSRGRRPRNKSENVSAPTSVIEILPVGEGNPVVEVDQDKINKNERHSHLKRKPRAKPKRKVFLREETDDEDDLDFVPTQGQDSAPPSSSSEEELASAEDHDEDIEPPARDYKKRYKYHVDPKTGNYTLLNITLEKLADDESGRGRYRCRECLRVVITSADTKNNIRSHVVNNHINVNKNKRHYRKCAVDDVTGNITFLNTILEKLPADESGQQRYQCTKCFDTIIINGSKSKPPDYRIKYHVYHKHSDKYKCDRCDKNFSSSLSRSIHIRYVHEKTIVHCPICEKPFGQELSMRRHKKSHLGAEEKLNLNKNKGTAGRPAITSKPKIQCEECGQIFTRDQLRNHRRAKHPTEEEKANIRFELCPECGKNVRHLKDHIERAHNKDRDRRFPCLKCDKRFKDKQTLRHHKRAVHEKIKNFKCDMCPKTFYDRRRLQVHKNVHLNIRPYQCEHCPSAFTSTAHLNRHVGVYHVGTPKRGIFVRGPKKRDFEETSESTTMEQQHANEFSNNQIPKTE